MIFIVFSNAITMGIIQFEFKLRYDIFEVDDAISIISLKELTGIIFNQ